MKKKYFLPVACISCLFLGAFIGQKLENQPITTNVIHHAQSLLGLEFTEAEADSMLFDVTDNRRNFEEIRKVSINNEIAPAVVFNPLPIGFIFDKTPSKFVPSINTTVKLPANKNDLAFMSVRELAELIRTKQITSLELTQFFLERLKTYDKQLACVITLTEDLAIQQAKKADAEIAKGKYKGLLHGIPYGAKDLLAKKGYKTTWGSVPFKDQVLDYDATVITRLEEAGAVLCAKLTLGELAWGDVWFGGTTKNPWNLKRGSSGSSAGSASSVSAGLLPFAIGSETLGSIVSPSSECGTTGLRPSFGRVPRTGAMALSWSMDKLGPICRTVEDCAIVFNAIKGTDGKDLSTIDASFSFNGNRKDLRGIRIAYLKKDFDRNYPTKTQDSISLATLRKLGAELIPLELPNYPVGDMTIILSAEAATAFDELTRNEKDNLMVRQIKNAWPNSFRASRFIPAVEYLQANRLRTKLIQDMETKLKDIDVYISPAFGNANLTLTNLSGHPCVVLPNGFRPEGRPTSITFMGKLFGEGKLLEVAKIYQDATDFHKKHPEWLKK